MITEYTSTAQNDSPIVMQQNQPTILLVEDSYEGQLLVKHYLAHNYNVLIVKTGEDAIDMLMTHDVQAVLMDLHLASDMTGLQTTQIIRSLPDKNNVPIIALTAFAMEGTRESCLEAGCNDYIEKPTTKQKLLAMLNTYIQ